MSSADLDDILAASESVIVAEVTFGHDALFGLVLPAAFTMQKKASAAQALAAGPEALEPGPARPRSGAAIAAGQKLQAPGSMFSTL